MDNKNIMHEEMEYTQVEDTITSLKKFSEQEIDLEKTPLFFPEGYENIFLTIYVIFLPYIVGVLFLFLYAAEGKKEVFMTINKLSSLIVTWAIGYEIIAAFIILYIIKMALSLSRSKNEEKQFQRP